MKHGPPTATRGPAAKSGLKSSLLMSPTAADAGPPIDGGSALTPGAIDVQLAGPNAISAGG